MARRAARSAKAKAVVDAAGGSEALAEAGAVLVAAAAKTAADDGEVFTVGAWSGRPQWRCKFCPWDTLKGAAEARRHYWETHRPAPAIVPVYDRRGNLVTAGSPSNVRRRSENG